MLPLFKKRMIIIRSLFFFSFLLITARLVQIQIIQANQHRERAQRYYARILERQALRGNIYDCRGRELAVNVKAYSIYANSFQVEDKKGTTAKLAAALNLDPQKVYKILNKRKYFVWIKRRVAPEAAKQVIKLPGINILTENVRKYPNGVFAAQVLGFIGMDNQGLEGLEGYWDSYLKGENKRIYAQVDALGGIVPQHTKEDAQPVNGAHLVLTIDARVQGAAELVLEKVVKDTQAIGGSIIVMKPQTGEMLAMANRPTFDPNNFLGYGKRSWRNSAVTDVYEPGSTFKIVVASCALEEGIINYSDCFYCAGTEEVGKHTIHCVSHHRGGHGLQTIVGILQNSCNIGAAKVGMKIGAPTLYKYIKAFGFGACTGIDFPGEATGKVEPPEKWELVKLANISFGQGISVTPLQLLQAYCVIANGGVLMKPYLVKEIINSEGEIVKEFKPKPIRQVISPATANKIKEMLKLVVKKGTGQPAALANYVVAGKTGTSQKCIPLRGYVNKYIPSFVGFVPADEPEIAILVMINEPQGTFWGATVAAPAFKEVARHVLWHLGISPSTQAKKL